MAKLRRQLCQSANGRAPWVDSYDRRGILSRDRWFKFVTRLADLTRFPVCISRSTDGARLLRAYAGDAVCALRRVYRTEFRALVFVLRDEPDSVVSAHQNLGRRKPRERRDQVFSLH